jgi:hypothetical protein
MINITKFEFIGGKLAGRVWRIDMSGIGEIIGVGVGDKGDWTIYTTFASKNTKLLYKVIKTLPGKYILERIDE